MTDRPIIFSAPMIRALLDGRKTMTRRILKLPKTTFSGGPIYERPDMGGWEPTTNGGGGTFMIVDGHRLPSPKTVGMWHKTTGVAFDAPYQADDRLWVRENFAHVPASAFRASTGVHQTLDPTDSDMAAIYAAGWERSAPRWKPSIHMPRWASRLTLIVTAVKVERLQSLSEADAQAEGIGKYASDGLWTWAPPGMSSTGWHTARGAFDALWTSIHGPDAWAANPWVAAITFRVVKANIDAVGVGA